MNFFAYGTLKFGVLPAGGDLDADGYHELATGPGEGAVFGPHVRGFSFDGAALTPIARINFFAYQTLKFGVQVAAGDVEGDSFAELLTAPGPGRVFGPQVRGFDYDGGPVGPIARINFNAFGTSEYGAMVATSDVDNDLVAEIVCAPGPGPTSSFPARFVGYDYDGGPLGALTASTSPSPSPPGTVGASVSATSPATPSRSCWPAPAVTRPPTAPFAPTPAAGTRSSLWSPGSPSPAPVTASTSRRGRSSTDRTREPRIGSTIPGMSSWISYTFVAAALFNIVGILWATRGLTNQYLMGLHPLFSPWGCGAIILWGLAYLALARSYESAPWVALVFALEKFYYVAVWITFLQSSARPSFAEIAAANPGAASFYRSFGIGDGLFGIFFLYVFLRFVR